MDRQKLIIDTDAGVDDAIAIMMALTHPRSEVIALTTVNGNVDVVKVNRNVAHILDVFGSDQPFFAGCSRPLFGEAMDSSEVHGSDGLGGVTDNLPESGRIPGEIPASLALIELVHDHAGEITLLCLGPLTNLALAVRLDPGIVERISKLVLMGGAVSGQGNASSAAEFNILADPEAAAIVFAVGFTDLSIISWETTLHHPIPWSDFDSLLEIDTDRARFFQSISQNTVKFLRDVLQLPGFLMPDPLAAAVALEPGCVREVQKLPVRVEVVGEIGRGLTSVDWLNQFGSPPNAHIVQGIDTDQVMQMIRLALVQ
jgi:purine nucleosidase